LNLCAGVSAHPVGPSHWLIEFYHKFSHGGGLERVAVFGDDRVRPAPGLVGLVQVVDDFVQDSLADPHYARGMRRRLMEPEFFSGKP
jgi:hypothetical protein